MQWAGVHVLACSGTAQYMWCHAGNVCNKEKVMNGMGIMKYLQ